MNFSEILKKYNLDKERDKKAIPSRVYFNHFNAINYYLQSNSEKYNLKKVHFYNNIKIKNDSFDIDSCRKLLWNSWSTEYAFLMTAQSENNEYHKFALHWHFPQIYYSIYLNMTAFHETQGCANNNHETSIKLFGNSIKDKHYPKAISFFASGLHNGFNYRGLESFVSFPKSFSSLEKIHSLEDAEMQIAKFLQSTREQNALNKRKRGAKEHAKLKDFQNKKGELIKNFTKKHWDKIYTSIPETTLLNIIYRLRIKANYHDIETFINADIDFKLFHEYLGNIVQYLNFVHEAYIHKAIGDDNYRKILGDFSGHLNEERAKYRYQELILNI